MKIEQSNKKYHTAQNIVYSCQYHVIFCPKYRRKVLTGEIETRLKELVLEKQSEYGDFVDEMEVMPDHVHLLLEVDPRLWTRSKFISTVGSVRLEVVKEYIEDQKNVLSIASIAPVAATEICSSRSTWRV